MTYDEQKAAEAAFRGLPLNPNWSQKAQQMYLGITNVTSGRDIVGETVANTDDEDAAVAA